MENVSANLVSIGNPFHHGTALSELLSIPLSKSILHGLSVTQTHIRDCLAQKQCLTLEEVLLLKILETI